MKFKKTIIYSMILIFAAGFILSPAEGARLQPPRGGCCGRRDLLNRATAEPDLGMFVVGIRKADLADLVSGNGQFTIFAPDNTAFGMMGDGVYPQLLLPDNKGRLRSILDYHIVPGRFMSGCIGRVHHLKTIDGRTLTVTRDCRGLMINGARIIATDIEADNGVIHIIDRVMLPQ